MDPKPDRKRSDHIADALEAMILDGSVASGERLDEVQLVDAVLAREGTEREVVSFGGGKLDQMSTHVTLQINVVYEDR